MSSVPPSHAPRRPRWRALRWLGRALRRTLRLSGWAAAGALAAGALLDRTEAFDRAVLAALRAALAGLGAEVALVDADIEWLDRTLVLRGVALDLGRREGFAEELRLRVGWRGGRPSLARAEWLGGELCVTRAMLNALEGRARTTEAGAADAAAERPLALPDLHLSDVDLRVEAPDASEHPLGRLGLVLAADSAGVRRLTGRFRPSFQRAPDRGGEVWITGALGQDGTLEAHGTARALRLAAEELPLGAPFDAVRRFAPECVVEFEGRGRLTRGESVLPELDLALRIADGRLQLPHLPDPAARPVQDVELLAEARFRPTGPDSLWSREAWDVRATLDGAFGGTRLAVAGRFGALDDGAYLAEVSAHARDMELGEVLLDLGGRTVDVVDAHAMLAPDGRADVSFGMRLPRDYSFDEGTARIEHGLAVVARGEASLAYHGSLSARGARDEGFPLQVQGLRGLVTRTYHPADEYPLQLGLHRLEGRHAGGPVHVLGSLHEIPGSMIGATPEERRARRPFFRSQLHLRIQSRGLAVDGELERAFSGLSGVRPVGEIFRDYGPAGGTLAFVLQLWRGPSGPDLATDLELELDGVGFRWRELPVPLEDVTGSLTVRTDGGGPELGRTIVSLDAAGRSPIAGGRVTVRGRTQSEGRERQAAAFEVDARAVNTRSSALREVLLARQPGVQSALDQAGVAGFADVAVVSSAEPGAAVTTAWVEVATAPDGVRLLPEAFQIPTEDVHGRVAVTARLPVRKDFEVERELDSTAEVAGRAVLQGRWSAPEHPVVLVGDVALAGAEQPPVLAVAGAGLDITNKGVLGSVADVVRSQGGSGDPLDPEALDIVGRFDFQARFELPERPGGPPGPSTVGVDARLERLGFADRPLLSDVAAHFRLVEGTGEWVGERISAQLGSTPVRLTDLRWAPTDGGSRISARLAADDLPLDREHLRLFLDGETLERALEDLALRGAVDVLDSTVEFERQADASVALRFTGRLGLDDMALTLGVPLELRDVDDMALDLALEGDRLRARASVRGLSGLLAGRRLDRTAVEVSYVHPRLAFHALDGRLEGGRIGASSGPGAQFFALDLAPPFPFELDARLEDVDVGEFLQGAFRSDFANEGRMDLQLALAGDIEHVTGLAGSGSVVVDETRLWAVPVFQALFARLGFPTTAVFRRIEARFRIADGVLWVDRTRADSDLLSVVGSGWVDLAGDLSTDLEVRYALVDRLGPLTQLLYKIQNSLLRVAVRGTMERPVVMLRGFVSQFFRPADARARLPLPGFSELPRRF